MKPGADALEVIVDEPTPRPPQPKRSPTAWARSHPVSVVAVAAALLGVVAAYTAVAVTGTAAIEREWRRSEELSRLYGQRVAVAREQFSRPLVDFQLDAPASDAAASLRDVTAAYLRAVDGSISRVTGTLAVDPGVRSLRRLVADRTRERADRLVESTTSAEPYLLDRGPGEVEQALRHQLRRWRLEPSTPRPPDLPPVPPRGPTPLAARATGDRLVARSPGTLLEIDVDTGDIRLLWETLSMAWVARREWVAVVDRQSAYAVAVPGGRRHELGPADYAVAGDDPETVWLVRGRDREFEAVEVDRAGVERGRAAGRGGLVWAGADHIVSVPFSDVEGDTDLVVTDRSGRRRPHVIERARFLAARGTTMAWAESFSMEGPDPKPAVLHVLDLSTRVERILTSPQGPGVPAAAAFSPDGRSVAVTWSRFRPGTTESTVAVHASDTYQVTASSTQADSTLGLSPSWAPSGERVYFLADGSPRRIKVLHVGDGTIEQVRLRGTFLDVAAF